MDRLATPASRSTVCGIVCAECIVRPIPVVAVAALAALRAGSGVCIAVVARLSVALR